MEEEDKKEKEEGVGEGRDKLKKEQKAGRRWGGRRGRRR